MTIAQLDLDEYLRALEKMKKSRRDRIGTLGELGVTGLGAAFGWLAASVFLVKTITVLGIAFTIGSTPIGWLIGSAVLLAALAFGLARLVRGGGKYDTLKDQVIRDLEKRINDLKEQDDRVIQGRIRQLRRDSKRSLRREPKVRKIIDSLELLVANGHMSQDKATALLEAIEKKHLRPREAFDQIQALIDEKASLRPASR